MSDLSDRVGRIEGELNHLATKSDIAEAKSELLVQIASIEGQLSILIWAVPVFVAIVSLIVQWAAPHLFQRKGQT